MAMKSVSEPLRGFTTGYIYVVLSLRNELAVSEVIRVLYLDLLTVPQSAKIHGEPAVYVPAKIENPPF